MKIQVKETPYYFGANGAYTNLGDVSGSVTVDFETYTCVEMNLTGDTTISFTDPVVRDDLQNRKLIISGANEYRYTLSSSELSGTATTQRPLVDELLAPVEGFTFGEMTTSGQGGSVQILDGNIYLYSQAYSSSDEGLWSINYSAFPNSISQGPTLDLNVTGEEAGILCSYITEDGLYALISGSSGDGFDLYEMSTAYDLTTATHLGYSGDIGSGFYGCYMKPDGTSVFGFTGSYYEEYELLTPFDITTINPTYVSRVAETALVLSSSAAGSTIKFYDSGNKLMLANLRYIFDLELTTAYDLTTATVVKIVPLNPLYAKYELYFEEGATTSDYFCFDFNDGYFVIYSDLTGLQVFPRANAVAIDLTYNKENIVIDNESPYKVY